MTTSLTYMAVTNNTEKTTKHKLTNVTYKEYSNSGCQTDRGQGRRFGNGIQIS